MYKEVLIFMEHYGKLGYEVQQLEYGETLIMNKNTDYFIKLEFSRNADRLLNCEIRSQKRTGIDIVKFNSTLNDESQEKLIKIIDKKLNEIKLFYRLLKELN